MVVTEPVVVEVPLESVQFDEALYPRAGYDRETVARYRLALDLLPPIAITEESWLIDGYHRLLAARMDQRPTIRAVRESLAREEVLWQAVARNAAHGLQLSTEEKQRHARAFCAQGRDLQAIATLLSVPYSTVRDWTRAQRQAQDQARDTRILALWLACHTQEQIAAAVGVSQKQVSVILAAIRESESAQTYTPDSLQVFNLWQFHDCDPRYGQASYPGRMPGQIVENLLYYYTEPFDLVVDPCAGGGTTADVCRALCRRYRCYDLAPLHEGIVQHNILDGFPPETRGCALIVLDPPYWQQKQGAYAAGPGQLAGLSLEAFGEALAAVCRNGLSVLRPGGHLAVIIGPTQRDGIVYDHALALAQALAGQVPLVQRIIVPYTTQQARGFDVAAAKTGRYLLKLYRDLLIFRREQP